MLILKQRFYEKFTGDPHDILVTKKAEEVHDDNVKCRRYYVVSVDGEFFSTSESRLQAFDEVADLIKHENWASIKPF